jgi:hypothetical protein
MEIKRCTYPILKIIWMLMDIVKYLVNFTRKKITLIQKYTC